MQFLFVINITLDVSPTVFEIDAFSTKTAHFPSPPLFDTP